MKQFLLFLPFIINTVGKAQSFPCASAYAQDDTICAGASTTLYAAVILGCTYVPALIWNPGGMPDSPPPVVSPSVTTTYTLTETNPNNGNTYTSTVTVNVVVCLGVETIETTGLFSIFPNPSNGIFSIQSDTPIAIGAEIIHVEIYNMLGEIVYSDNLHSGKTEINLKDKSKGMYLYKAISGNNNVSSGKLVICAVE